MFRKLVSNLAFSPALIGEVGFYAKRLRKEEVTRRLTVLFTVLALIMQSLAVFSPPESANASSEQDIIRGGVSSLGDFIERYDHNEEDVKDIYSAIGISRDDIVHAHPATVKTDDKTYIMSRFGGIAGSSNDVQFTYPRSVGGTGVRYFSDTKTANDSSLQAWVGNSSALGWFAIIESSGAVATHDVPRTLSTPGSTQGAGVKLLSSKNLSTGTLLSDSTLLQPLEKISYSLTVTNPSNSSLTSPVSVRIADILEYADIIDAGGGLYDATTSTLSWPQVQIPPGNSQVRTFVVQLKAVVPATASGKSNSDSYDCKMTITFGNTLQSPVDCPVPKAFEGIFALLPPTDTTSNIIFGAAIFIIVCFFYVRTRQLRHEIRLIRHNFNSGIL